MTITTVGFALLLSLISAHGAATEACRVLVVVGMEDERAIAAGDGVDVVVGSANANVLRARLNAIDAATVSAVYSFGVAGGLDPELTSGDLLVSSRVSAQSTETARPFVTESWAVDKDLRIAIIQAASNADVVTLREGVFLGSDFEARDNPQANSRDLRAASGADIIDNESHIAAAFASAHHLPFIAVRAVSDSVDVPLPPAALIALDADGSPNGTAIIQSLLDDPLQTPTLIRTAWEYQKALRTLKVFRREIGFVTPPDCNQR